MPAENRTSSTPSLSPSPRSFPSPSPPLRRQSSVADVFSTPRTARASSPSAGPSGDRKVFEGTAQLLPSPAQRPTPGRHGSSDSIDQQPRTSDSGSAAWRSSISTAPVLSPSLHVTPRTPSPTRQRPPIRFSRPSPPPPADDLDIFCTASKPGQPPQQTPLPAPGDGELPLHIRLPPRPSDLPDPHSTPPSRETSPSRFPLISPLARIATVKHARSQSSPMGLTGERSPSRPGSSSGSGSPGVLSHMFNAPDATAEPRVGDTRRRSLFNFSFSTPKRRPVSLAESIETIDEFAGLSFTALLESYLEEPTATPTSPAEALMRTPEGRLSQAVSTAADLLERVYSAYRRRTESLQDALTELELHKEKLETERNRSAALQLGLDRISEDAQLKSTESAAEISAQNNRIADLEAELAAERARREKAEDIRSRLAERPKRASVVSASDSGFESDADSMMSRGSTIITSIASSSSSTSEEYVNEPHHACERCRNRDSLAPPAPGSVAAAGAEPKQPTPLREAWAADGAAGVWGLIKGRNSQQITGTWSDGKNANGVMVENKLLKQRIAELEKAVDSALEAVAGRGV